MHEQITIFNLATQPEFRPVLGFPTYRVGDDGSVWSYHRGDWHELKGTPNSDGHLRQTLCHAGTRVNVYVHRLVLLAFVGPCPDGLEGCHDDGDPGNNAVWNLRWDTPEANQADRLAHGTTDRGHSKRLTLIEKRELFALREEGWTYLQLAERFDMTERGVIYAVKRSPLPRRPEERVGL